MLYDSRLFLYLDLNSFFASCEQQEDPSLRGKPVAVVPSFVDTTCCIAASYQAKKFGVKTGTSVRDAKKLCPGIILRTGRHDSYIKYHHRVIEAVDKCLPVHAVYSIDEMACELTGSQKNFKFAKDIAQKIKATIRDEVGECLTASIGIAPNVLLAKMASDMQKPDGLILISADELPQRLFPLKLQDVPGIGPRMNMRLHKFGVRSMEQFLSLNEQQMRSAWGGVIGARYYHLLRGMHIEVETKDTQNIGHQHVLPPGDRTWLGAKLVAQKLLSKAALRLRRNEMMTKQLSIYIKYYNEVRWEDVIVFDETQDTAFLISQLNHLYQYAPKNEKPLKVTINLSRLISAKEHQLSFFENSKRSELFKVVDQINDKFGKNTIYVGSLQEKLDAAPTRISFTRIPGVDEV